MKRLETIYPHSTFYLKLINRKRVLLNILSHIAESGHLKPLGSKKFASRVVGPQFEVALHGMVCEAEVNKASVLVEFAEQRCDHNKAEEGTQTGAFLGLWNAKVKPRSLVENAYLHSSKVHGASYIWHVGAHADDLGSVHCYLYYYNRVRHDG